MDMSFLSSLLMVAYLLTSILTMMYFLRMTQTLERLSTAGIITTFFLHSLYLVFFTLAEKLLPFFSIRDFLVIISWFLLLFLFYLELMTNDHSFRLFILVIALLTHAIAIFTPYFKDISEMRIGPLLGIHIIMLLIAYSCFIVSFVAALMYIFLFKEIKQRKLGFFFARFASLERLDRINLVSIFGGLFFLTIGIFTGFLWGIDEQTVRIYDIKIIFTVIVWFGYMLTISYRKMFGWQGRRYAFFSVSVFFLVLANIAIGILFEGTHKF